MKASGHTAVMASRHEAIDSLDFFPTPPWATRALFEALSWTRPRRACWEPACGLGHMSDVLTEFFYEVRMSDVHPYGHGEVASFVGDGPDVAKGCQPCDWVVTNPPFKLASEFALRALQEASEGVALLVRTAWLEGGDRYTNLFGVHPPWMIAQFSERVPMCKGRWDPAGSTATAYCWVVWRIGHQGDTRFTWVRPGARARLTKPDDVARFAARSA